MNKLPTLAVLLSATLMTMSCERLEPDWEFPDSNSIPASYGALIGVTPHQAHPYQAVLWFEQKDGSVTAVRVNVSQGNIMPEPVTFTRQ